MKIPPDFVVPTNPFERNFTPPAQRLVFKWVVLAHRKEPEKFLLMISYSAKIM
jgi:hypothetical protein